LDFPFLSFWWVIPFVLLTLFACSLNSKIKNTQVFNIFSVRASIAGFYTSVMLFVFSIAVYWPVVQNPQQEHHGGNSTR
jgi:uncharacterized membrane protein